MFNVRSTRVCVHRKSCENDYIHDKPHTRIRTQLHTMGA